MPLHPLPRRRGPHPRRLAVALTGLAATALLGACGEQTQHQTQTEPTRTVTEPPPVTTTVPARPTQTRTTTAPPSSFTTPTPGQPGLDPKFDTCKEANAHGYYDYVKGRDPEYYWYIDRDGDGIDCEPPSGATPTSPSPAPPTEQPSTPTPSTPTEEPSPPTEEPTTPEPTEPPDHRTRRIPPPAPSST